MTTLTKEVTLSPGQSELVSFQVTPQEAGVYSVSVNGLTGSFAATAPGLIGDLDDDGALSSADLGILVKYIVGIPISQISPLTETEFLRRADVNGDGIINSLDITALETLIPPPEIDYSGKREWCAYRIYHEFPGRQNTTWVVTKVEGEIGNLSVELTKAGLAGVEATFQINTGGENISNGEYIALEVLGWWQYGKYLTGVTIYDYNYSPTKAVTEKVDAEPGEMLHYRVYIIPGGALTKIWNSSGELIFEYLYECDAKRFLTLQTELEYWRYYEQAGQFHFAGEVTLDKVYREGTGWVNADICSFFVDTAGVTGICEPKDLLKYNHYKEGGSWIFEGEVIDIV